MKTPENWRVVPIDQDSHLRWPGNTWALREVDAEGSQIGGDKVIFDGNLFFAITEMCVNDELSLAPGQAPLDSQKISIRAKLAPKPSPFSYSPPTFSWLGSNRSITRFLLSIFPHRDEEVWEHCRLDGRPGEGTIPDTLFFDLYVHQERFAQLAAKVTSAEITKADLYICDATGLYSDWDPEGNAQHIKALLHYQKEKLELPENVATPPHLGWVRDFRLTLRSIRRLASAAPHSDDDVVRCQVEELVDTASENATFSALPAHDNTAILSSLRGAAWIIVGLLLLILVRLQF